MVVRKERWDGRNGGGSGCREREVGCGSGESWDGYRMTAIGCGGMGDHFSLVLLEERQGFPCGSATNSLQIVYISPHQTYQ